MFLHVSGSRHGSSEGGTGKGERLSSAGLRSYGDVVVNDRVLEPEKKLPGPPLPNPCAARRLRRSRPYRAYEVFLKEVAPLTVASARIVVPTIPTMPDHPCDRGPFLRRQTHRRYRAYPARHPTGTPRAINTNPGDGFDPRGNQPRLGAGTCEVPGLGSDASRVPLLTR
jgi:hypothetical protein